MAAWGHPGRADVAAVQNPHATDHPLHEGKGLAAQRRSTALKAARNLRAWLPCAQSTEGATWPFRGGFRDGGSGGPEALDPGGGVRPIARATSIDRKTVPRYVEAAEQAGLVRERGWD